MADDPMGVEFVPATVDDVPKLAAFMPGLYAYEGEAPDVTAWSNAVGQLLKTPELGRIWLICLNDQPIGYVALTFGYSLEFYGSDAFVDELFIDASYRNQGIGRQTLDFIELYARSVGLRSLHLEVDDTNRDSQRFYEARGFHFRRHMHLMSKHL